MNDAVVVAGIALIVLATLVVVFFIIRDVRKELKELHSDEQRLYDQRNEIHL